MALRVLFVIDNLNISGAEKVAVNLLRNAHRFKDVLVAGAVCMDDSLGAHEVSPNLFGLTTKISAEGSLLLRLYKALRAVFALRKLCRNIDVLVPVTPPAAFIAQLASVGRQVTVVPWIHYDFTGIARDQWPRGRRLRGWLQRVLYLHFMPSFPQMIFVSDECRESFPARSSPGVLYVTLPNVYLPESFLSDRPSQTADAMRSLKREGAPLLVFIGRIFRQKRWEDVLEVANLLHAGGFDFDLAIIGDGIEREALLEIVKSSPAQDRIHYLGEDRNAEPALRLADGLLLTSLFEAWPTVILEAFDADVPVFAYDCPSGPRRMLGAGSRGMLCEEVPQSMAEAITTYFALDHTRRRAMLSDAKQFLQDFLPVRAVPRWEQALQTLATRART